MSLRKLFITGAMALIVSAAAPSKASADWLFTPFIGANFGGSARLGGFDLDGIGNGVDVDFEKRLDYGASLAWMGHGAIGFEVDFGYSPNFFEPSDSSSNLNLIGDGNVTTLMANLMVGAPLGGLRPYASGGVGLIKTRVDDVGQFFGDIDSSNFGLNVGGGIMGFFNDNIGLRGDIRYFRSITDNEPGDGVDLSLGNFDFWRGSVGVTFRF